MGSKVALGAFVVLTVAIGSAIGWLNAPADWAWYASLVKPSFNPPNWVFGPVWTLLYILIGIVGWSVWVRLYEGGLALLWTLQLILNFAWSPIFFMAHRVEVALIVIVALFIVIVLFILRAVRIGRAWEAAFFALYGLWIAFATALNTAIYVLNPV